MIKGIKYRIWCKKNKGWVQDKFLLSSDGEILALPFRGVNDFNPEDLTIGYSTGYIDENNVEIYEGDIIRSYDSQGEEILHMVDRNGVWHLPINKMFDTAGGITQEWIVKFGKEVIGNVHNMTVRSTTDTFTGVVKATVFETRGTVEGNE